MGKSARYCIRCGREIGESYNCSNPECEGIPNFYRNVPGPDASDSTPQPKPHRLGRHTSPAPAASAGRATIPISRPIAILKSLSGESTEHLLFPGRTEIGAQSPARIRLGEPEISSRHARIVCGQTHGTWRLGIIDLQSTNGTFVNDKRVARGELRDGDVVRFARVEFEVQFCELDEPRVTIAL